MTEENVSLLATDNEEPAAKKPRLDEEPSVDTNDDGKNNSTHVHVAVCAQMNEPNAQSSETSETQLAELTKVAGKGGKRKFAILLCYCGKGYFGMQRNPGVRTIEEDLIQALFKAGAISADMRDNLGMMFFQRCARTDKGVSAIRQLVSVKMYETNADKDKINAHLPLQIRVVAVIRVTKKFNSKDYCVARSYEYLLPTYALSPTFEQTRKDFRITSDQIERVNRLLSLYVGTHNFHNFTSGKSPHEASAKRHIKEFCCGKKFEAEGIEFIVLRVKGQSFMLHQIRKMIGLVIAIVRNIADQETLCKSFEKDKADIPMAPGLGLMLENVFYDGYNKRYADDGMHSALDWDQYSDETDAFKNDHIYSHIITTEIINGTVIQWLGTIPLHSFAKKTAADQDNSTTDLEKVQEKAASDEEGKTVELTNPSTSKVANSEVK